MDNILPAHELIGDALNRAVAAAIYSDSVLNFSADYAAGGPLMDLYKVDTDLMCTGEWRAVTYNNVYAVQSVQYGPTRLIASMRAIVDTSRKQHDSTAN